MKKATVNKQVFLKLAIAEEKLKSAVDLVNRHIDAGIYAQDVPIEISGTLKRLQGDLIMLRGLYGIMGAEYGDHLRHNREPDITTAYQSEEPSGVTYGEGPNIIQRGSGRAHHRSQRGNAGLDEFNEGI